MSGRLVSAVLDDAYFKQADKSLLLVAVVIADAINNETGVCWPSLETIAGRARTSVRAAQGALHQLQDDGKLSVEVNAGPMGTNLYRMTPATNSAPPATVLNPPATERHAVAPKPEGTVPPIPKNGDFPAEDEFVRYFLPLFVSYSDFPAEPYLRHRWSDFDATGWKKGSRQVVKWRSLSGSLVKDYRQDREERLRGGNLNGASNRHRKPLPPRITETDEDRLIREARERGDIQ